MNNKYITVFILIIPVFFSCKKFLEIDPPVSDIIRTEVFANDATAEGAIRGIYSQLADPYPFSGGSLTSVTFAASLSADEMVIFNPTHSAAAALRELYNNAALSTNSVVASQWSTLFQTIYRANSVIEGLEGNNRVSAVLKARLTGEAKFIRAFCNFYLVNLWGDAPLALTTDYSTNAAILRSPVSAIYQQIIADLKDAQSLLPPVTGERIRIGKEAATALLARAYLFSNEYVNAEAQATAVINSSISLEADLNSVFLKASDETIWQLAFNNTNGEEARTFIFTGMPVNGALQQNLINAFEPADLRRAKWVGNTTVSGIDYFFPWKYKATSNTPITEHSVVMRLAEQYLVRAEARARQNNIAGAQEDINTIRNRAGLGNTVANDQSSLLAAIAQERRVELFTEWGHRWLDLKRTGNADVVLTPLKPQWKITAALYPIPDAQLIHNKAMTQNPGY